MEAEEIFSQAYSSLASYSSFAEATPPGTTEQEIFTLHTRFYAAAGYFQLRLGRIERSIAMMEESISRLTSSTSTGKWVHGTILLALANAVHYHGEFTRTRAIAEEAGRLFREQNDKRNLSFVLYMAGLAAEAEGDYEGSEKLAQEGYQIAGDIGSQILISLNSRTLGKVTVARGHYKKAQRYLQRSLDIMLRFSYHTTSMLLLNELGDVARLQSKLNEAKMYYERSFTISSEMNSPTAMASTYWGLGNLALQAGDYDAAKAYFGKSRQTTTMSNWSPGGPGWVPLALGEVTEARRIFQTELQTIVRLKQAPGALDTLAGLAHVQAMSGELAYATELITLILQHPASAHESKKRVAQLRDELIAELPAAAVLVAAAQGQRLDL